MRSKRNRYRPPKGLWKKVVMRWVRIASVVLTVVVGIPLLSAVFAQAYYALLEAPWPRVEEIDIHGLKHVTRKEILNRLEVPPQVNVMSLRMAELGKRLEHLPWLKSSVVRLDLPGRIVVEVVEREPMALVYIDGFQLVDREGRIFDRGAVDQYPGLLLVTGLNRSHVADGEVLKGRVMRVLTELLDALAQIQSWLPTQQISECHWQDGDGLVLHTVQGAFPIHLGFGNYAAKFAKLQRILVLLKNSEYAGTVTRIDLDYSNRAFIEGRFSTAKGI